MKLIGVSLLALLAGACSGEDADRAFITGSWTFRSVAANVPLPCPDGYPWVYLRVHARDGSACNAAGEVECPSRLSCALGMGTSIGLLPAVYDAWFEVTSEDETTVYATSAPGEVDLSLGDKTFARQFVTDGGVFHLAWNLVDDTGASLTCHDAGVARLQITVADEADPSSAGNDEPSCVDGSTYTLPYASGTYSLMFDPITETGQSRGTADPLMGQVIGAPNGITDLGTIDVLVSR